MDPEASARLLGDAGRQVATFTHRAFAFAESALVADAVARLIRTTDIAATIGASSITMTTGRRGRLT